jgi:ABC-type transport system involved in multi-copper enzyme maturation permease subunit
MKALAILKDSLREALDSRVLYVLLAISVAVALLLGLFGYKQMTAEEELQSYASFWTWRASMLDRGTKNPALGVDIQDFQATKEPPPDQPWKGAYSFTLVVHCRDQEQAEKVRDARTSWMRIGDPNKGTEEQLVFLFFYARNGWWLKDLDMKPLPGGDSKSVAFRVTSSGTRVTSRAGWVHEPTFCGLSLSFAHASLSSLVSFFMDVLVGSVGASVAMLLGIVVTASFIPNMLRKGTVDLLLAKPIRRPALLLYKFVGSLSFMFLATAATVVLVWLAIGLRSGLWPVGFLLATFLLTYQFAVYYAFSALFGVLTRSTIVSILMACLLWAVLFAVGWLHGYVHPPRPEPGEQPAPDWVVAAVDGVHAVLPRMDQLNALRTELIGWGLPAPDRDEDVPRPSAAALRPHQAWLEPVAVSLAFIVVLLGLACWVFSRRDY